MLYHRNCGGPLSVDITNIISWKSPSISIQTEGIKIGVTEISGSTEVNPDRATFFCEECHKKSLPLAQLEEFADMECPVCTEKTHLNELMISRTGFCLCSSCLKIAKGEKTTKKERILKTIKYFNLEDTRMTFYPLSEKVSKRIIF